MSKLLTEGPQSAETHLILAHGAGAPMTSDWMSGITHLLTSQGLRVTRFEFAYMAARREGTRKPPPKAERLTAEYAAVVEQISATLAPGQRLVIGGKSMGGRVASMIAEDLYVRSLVSGLICLGYPFHPPKKPVQLRTAHLATLRCPTLIVQGERDPLGTRTEIETYTLAPAITLEWLPDGDHDLAPRRSSGITTAQNLAHAAKAIARFCSALG